MRRFRVNTIFLIIGLSLFFNIDKIYTNFSTSIRIEQFIYIHGVLSVIIVCYSPIFQKIHHFPVIILNLLIFILEKYFISDSYPLLGGIYSYLTITESTLLSTLLYLAHQQSKSIGKFEQAVDQISFGDELLNPLSTIEDSMHDIQSHMHFSRRHTTPLSILVIDPDPESLQALIRHALHEAYRNVQMHCTLTKLAALLKPELRRTDLIIENRQDGRLLIVCPGTSPEEILMLTTRLQTTVDENALTIRYGYASFPNEAFTFDELILQAESHLQTTNSRVQPEPAPEHIESVIFAETK